MTRPRRLMDVKKFVLFFLPLIVAAGTPDADSCRRKFELIQSDKLKPGARVVLTRAELNAFAAEEAAAVPGIRHPQLQLGTQKATGEALIDFGKVRRAQGYKPGWIMSKLLDGERPVRVTAKIQSSGGQATVDVESVEVSGVTIDGNTLQFLIHNFLTPLYPNAVIARPFELGHRIDRIDVQPAEVRVYIGK